MPGDRVGSTFVIDCQCRLALECTNMDWEVRTLVIMKPKSLQTDQDDLQSICKFNAGSA